jgi:hypothetical protein
MQVVYRLPLQKKEKHLRLPKNNQVTNKTINRRRAWEHMIPTNKQKKEPEAIAEEKQNSSFLEHTTYTLDDGQLRRNM